jgi:hypothetical protein
MQIELCIEVFLSNEQCSTDSSLLEDVLHSSWKKAERDGGEFSQSDKDRLGLARHLPVWQRRSFVISNLTPTLDYSPLMTEVAIRGGCLCEAVTYTILEPPKEELERAEPVYTLNGKICGNHCHCDTCRNACGGLFQTLASVPLDRINIVDSKKSLTTYRVSDNADRQHCAICGTTMWIKDKWDGGYIIVSVGSMRKEDAKKWVDVRHHIFLGDTIEGGVWKFQDDLPKYVLW